MKQESKSVVAASEKKSYAQPQLNVIGTVRELTAGTGGGAGDSLVSRVGL